MVREYRDGNSAVARHAVKHYEHVIKKTKADYYKKKFAEELDKAKKL